MNNFRYIVILLTICTAFISCEREDSRRYPVEESGRPIRFTTESVWPNITKAPITGLGDLLDDGFRVWGAWAKDPDDKSYFVGDYASGTNGSVFGSAGTAVNAVDENGDDIFDPNEGGDCWAYDNIRDWYRGYYSFAAVMPNSLFNSESTGYLIKSASFASSFSKTGSGNEVTVVYDNTLTLDFPGNSLLLGGHNVNNDIRVSEENQKDIMFAFQTEDNSDSQSENVSLNFTHAFARLGVNLIANDPDNIPDVKTVTVYGINKAITGPLKFTQKITQKNYRSSNPSEPIIENNIIMQGSGSTLENPYARFTMPEGHYKNDLTPENMTLFEDLIVFPEDLSETALQVKLEFNKVKINDDSSIEILGQGDYTINVATGKWEPGGSYVYSFMVDEIDLNGLQREANN